MPIILDIFFNMCHYADASVTALNFNQGEDYPKVRKDSYLILPTIQRIMENHTPSRWARIIVQDHEMEIYESPA